MTIADREVLSESVHFAQRREARKHLRTTVQEVTFLGVISVLQPANEDAVVGTKGVVHAGHVMGAGELGWRIPDESGGVQPVAHAETVRQRCLVDQRDHRRVRTHATRVVGEDIVTVHTVSSGRAVAHGHSGKQVAACVHQPWRIACNVVWVRGAARPVHQIDAPSHEAEHPRSRQCRINPRCAENAHTGGGNRLGLLD